MTCMFFAQMCAGIRSEIIGMCKIAHFFMVFFTIFVRNFHLSTLSKIIDVKTRILHENDARFSK